MVKDRDLLLPGGGGLGSLAEAGKSTPKVNGRPVKSDRRRWTPLEVKALMTRWNKDAASLARLCGRSRGTILQLIRGQKSITDEWAARFDGIAWQLMDRQLFVDNPGARAPVPNEATLERGDPRL